MNRQASLGSTEPRLSSVPTCPRPGSRAQARSMMAEGHRRRRRAASLTAPSTAVRLAWQSVERKSA